MLVSSLNGILLQPTLYGILTNLKYISRSFCLNFVSLLKWMSSVHALEGCAQSYLLNNRLSNTHASITCLSVIFSEFYSCHYQCPLSYSAAFQGNYSLIDSQPFSTALKIVENFRNNNSWYSESLTIACWFIFLTIFTIFIVVSLKIFPWFERRQEFNV